MKKLISIFSLLLLVINAYTAVTISVEPALNMGTAIYVTDNSGKATVSITNYKTGAISTTNGGPLGSLTGTDAIGAKFSTGTGYKKYIYVYLTADQGSVSGSCGTINVTNMRINQGGLTPGQRYYKITGVDTLADLPNGLFITMDASFSGTPTQSCTISGPITGVTFKYKNSQNANQGTYQDANINVSLDLVIPNYFEHDNGAKIDFGTFCRSNQTQTLTVTSAGTEGSSNYVCHSGSVSADSFTLSTASSSVSFSVTLPTSPITLSNGVDTLTVNNFTSSCTSCMTSNGSATFTVGATISIPGGSSVGSYTGTYPVSVTY